MTFTGEAGTVRLDLSEAAIAFYEKQGTTVIRVQKPVSDEPCQIRISFEGTPSFQNGNIQVITNAKVIGSCRQTLDVFMSLIDTSTRQQLKIIKKSKDFGGSGNLIVILEAHVLPKTVNGEIFVWTKAGVPVSNKITFQVQEGVTPPPDQPPTPEPRKGIIDKIVIGALIAGAILPLGKKL